MARASDVEKLETRVEDERMSLQSPRVLPHATSRTADATGRQGLVLPHVSPCPLPWTSSWSTSETSASICCAFSPTWSRTLSKMFLTKRRMNALRARFRFFRLVSALPCSRTDVARHPSAVGPRWGHAI